MVKFTDQEKSTIMSMLCKLQETSGVTSDSKYSVRIGIDKATWSRAKRPEMWYLLSDSTWLKLAQYARYSRNNNTQWNHADTQVSRFLFQQFEMCQTMGMTAMLADDPGIGKTHCMREYERTHSNVMCVDCSVSNTKGSFIRAIAQVTGVAIKGKLQELLDAAIYAIGLMEHPLIIFDESGDLEPGAMLQLKKLYNALELQCGFYMMGSDGFRSRIKRGVEFDKLGYTEVFSRFDNDFKRAMSEDLLKRLREYKEMAKTICKANGVEDEEVIDQIINESFEGKRGRGDLRRIKREIFKRRMLNGSK